MARTSIEIIDPYEARQRHRQRLFFIAACIIALILLSIPEWVRYRSRYQSLVGARKLAEFLSEVRTEAALKGRARIIVVDSASNTTKPIEVFDAASCSMNEKRQSLRIVQLLELAPSTSFVTDEWVRARFHYEGGQIKQICYNPEQQIEVYPQGQPQIALLLAASNAVDQNTDFSAVTFLMFDRESGNLSLE